MSNKYRGKDPDFKELEEFEKIKEEQNKKELSPDLDKTILEDKPVSTSPKTDEKLKELDGEEETFKKRYGDLRRHSQQMEGQLRKENEDLKKELKEATETKINFPNEQATPEEIKDWMEQYPNLGKIIWTIAQSQNKELEKKVKETTQNIEELDRRRRNQEAFVKLMELQPEAPKLARDPDFINWLNGKSDAVKAVMYDRLDPEQASDVIDLFYAQSGREKPLSKEAQADKEKRKAEQLKESKTNQQEQQNREAAAPVQPTRSEAPADGSGELEISESLIERMVAQDKTWFERNEKIIDEARRKGKFVYDLTKPELAAQAT